MQASSSTDPQSLEEVINAFIEASKRVEEKLSYNEYRNFLRCFASQEHVNPKDIVKSSVQPVDRNRDSSRDDISRTLREFIRPQLVGLLRKYWHGSLYRELSHDNVASWMNRQWRWYSALLRQLDDDEELCQWRRAIAELRILDTYEDFRAQARKKRTGGEKRSKGERDSTNAVREFLAANAPDHHDTEDGCGEEAREAQRKALLDPFRRNLNRARRWRILIDGSNDGLRVEGLGLGVVLAGGEKVRKKIYNGRFNRQFFRTLLSEIRDSRPDIVECCKALEGLAQRLYHYHLLDQGEQSRVDTVIEALRDVAAQHDSWGLAERLNLPIRARL